MQGCESPDKNLNSDFFLSDFQTFLFLGSIQKYRSLSNFLDFISVVLAIFRFFFLVVTHTPDDVTPSSKMESSFDTSMHDSYPVLRHSCGLVNYTFMNKVSS